MAVTTKFNRIAQVFCAKIGYPTTITVNVITATEIMTVAQIQDYVNRAMESLFTKSWVELKGDVGRFANMFPELILHADNGTMALGVSSVAAFQNIFKLFGCRADDVYCRVWDISKYPIAKAGKRLQYVGSAASPGVILKDDELVFFGIVSSANVDIDYIIKPLKADGTAFVSSANDEDVPFSEHWAETIAQIATDLYNQEAQNMS